MRVRSILQLSIEEEPNRKRIPVIHQYPAHGQHAQPNMEGDLLIKNELPEWVEGEHIRYGTRAQGSQSAATLPGAGYWRRNYQGAGSARAQMNALEGLKYHHITIM